jgi:hypothetical protein
LRTLRLRPGGQVQAIRFVRRQNARLLRISTRIEVPLFEHSNIVAGHDDVILRSADNQVRVLVPAQ